MKNKYQKLLILLPLFPFLMANSPAPQIREEVYKDYELSYVGEEQHYNYYFYRFHLHNTGNGYIEYIHISNKIQDSAFGAYVGGDEIGRPFYEALIKPGFDDEIVFATQSKIPDSKQVDSEVYAYATLAEEISFNAIQSVKLMSETSAGAPYYYEVKTSYSGAMSQDYYYGAALEITYDNVSYCVKSRSIDSITFSTTELLDLEKLSIDKIVALKSTQNVFYDTDFKDALSILLIFLLVSGLILSFGIFAAIFFPAMARRRRRNRLLQSQNK